MSIFLFMQKSTFPRFCNLPEQLMLYMGEDNSKERIITIVFGKKEKSNDGFVTGMIIGDLFHHL